MATKTARALAQVLRSCAPTAEVTDRELLRRFAEGDQTAFTALVRRHAGMVYGVCRRAVPTAQDAEDVCQATFLVLAQKAGHKRWQASVANWLYTTARRIAARARLAADRRRRRERKAARPEAVSCLEEMSGRELLALLDEELDRLPGLYREPLVLCYLQGLTHDQAAARLGVPLATLNSRVDRGRKKLGQALTRRGCGLGAGLLALAVASRARASSLRLIHAILATVSTTPPAAVAVLAQGVPMNALVLKVKLAILAVAAISAVAVGLGAMNLRAANQQTESAPSVRVPISGEIPAAEQATKAPRTDDTRTVTLAGHVLGPDGKAVAGADVAVLAWQALHQSYQSSFEEAAWQHGTMPGRTKADAEGKLRLTIKVPLGSPQPTLRVLAGARGLGIVWALLDPRAESAEVELRLPAEQVVRGRVVNLQGAPVAGARVVLTGVKHRRARGEKEQQTWGTPPEGLPFGPVSTTTNARGDFTFRGLGNNLTAEFEVHDDRVELHTFSVDTSDKKQAENVKVALAPGRVVEGRVTYADTGKPVAGARVMIQSGGGRVRGLTDKDGRYHLNVRRSELPDDEGAPYAIELAVHVFAPPGEPYWMKTEFVRRWVKGVMRHETNVALPRGVLLRGKITEAGTGKPVAGAEIEYNDPFVMHRWKSGADGSYAFVLPADAHRPLTVNGPSPDYIPQVVGSAEFLAGKKGGMPIYSHAIVPLGLKPGAREKEVPIQLRRGVTLKGRLVGPDGKPAKDAILLVGGYKPPREKFLRPIQVRDGHFELPGCDPDKTYHLIFVEHAWLSPDPSGEIAEPDTYGQLWLRALFGPQIKLGATVDVAAKKTATEPVEVRLQPCGAAKLRFVDGAGKPLAKFRPWLHLVVTGGPPITQAIKDGKLAAEAVLLIHPLDAEPYADADGVLNVEGLIPGATYRLQRFDGEVIKELKVEPGKTLELTVPVK